MKQPDASERLLTKSDAAKFLLISVETLDRLERRKQGPPRIRIGHQVRYRLTALLAYLDSLTARRPAARDPTA